MQAASLKCRAFTHSPISSASRRTRPATCRAAAVTSRHVSSYSSFMGTRLAAPQFGISKAAAPTMTPAKQTTTMSFFGVGAPEAILVAIVSLVVFGPKGLAEAAKSIGSSLRAFKPTIKEVVEVSQDLRSTLENELGLDELRDAAKPPPRSMPKPLLNDPTNLPEVSAAQAATTAAAGTEAAAATTATGAPTTAGQATPATAAEAGTTSLKAVSETFAKAVDPEIEAKRAASAAMAWGGASPAAAPAAAAPAAAGGAPAATATAAPPAVKDASQLSLEELEAELARRRKSA